MRAALIALAMMATAAFAHDAPMGWAYDPSCCSGRDCKQMPNPRVQIGPDGYTVTIEPGEHPFVKTRVTATFRFPDGNPLNDYPIGPDGTREAKRSGDEHYHACVVPGGRFLCLYVPDTGA